MLVGRFLIVLVFVTLLTVGEVSAGEALLAGVARADITSPTASRVHDPCFAKALTLSQGDLHVVVITVDAVAIGGIGYIPDSFLSEVRRELAEDPGIPAEHVIVNASHCHGHVRRDSHRLVVQAVREAWGKRVPVKVGNGTVSEDRISENRRVVLKDGRQVDMRRAYAFAGDEEIAAIGPIDPEVGLLRLDREQGGSPLAVVYGFACHPIMNPPSRGSSADFPGVASTLIESTWGDGCLAFFLQGCGGDINPVRYKEVNRPADATPLGLQLGATVLAGLPGLRTEGERSLAVKHRRVAVPRAVDFQQRIDSLEAERDQLVGSLKGTDVNFKSFLPLLIKHRLFPDFPSAYAQGYLHDQSLGRDELKQLDEQQRAQVANYMANIGIMERLTRLNTNLKLLQMHQRKATPFGGRPLDVEMCALRIGDFKLVTFPGELTVEIGLRVKQAAQEPGTFVAGYTNGYIHYTPTIEQRTNTGYAQEDCDSMVAPEWQRLFEQTALEMLRSL